MNNVVSHVHVAVAVIGDDQGRVLIAKRPMDKHQGGLWEFPGGKVEAGEDCLDALKRELLEEVGIEVAHARSLIRIWYRYPDKAVLLDVWRIDKFHGEAHGREAQTIEWCAIDALTEKAFPAANRPIITAIQLPDSYMITPSPGSRHEFLTHLETALSQGIRLVQLRAKGMESADYKKLAKQVVQRCHAHGARLLLNAEPEWVAEVGADGVQLDSSKLKHLQQRPLGSELLVAASCHDEEELQQAIKLDVDFALLSPIKWTRSHPDTEPLGWEKMRSLVDQMPMPVYALGGVSQDDLDDAFHAGGQGVAAIRSLWPGA